MAVSGGLPFRGQAVRPVPYTEPQATLGMTEAIIPLFNNQYVGEGLTLT